MSDTGEIRNESIAPPEDISVDADASAVDSSEVDVSAVDFGDVDSSAVEESEPGDPIDSDAIDSDAIDLDAIERDLTDVQTALDRLNEGTYWTDEVTGQPIPDDVLAAHPTARTASPTL